MPSRRLEEAGERVVLPVLLDEHLKVLIDGCHGEEDARAGADGTHEVSDDGEGADAHAAEGGRGRDVAVELLRERRVAVPLHDHLLVAQLLGDILGRRARDLDPRLGEECARDEDEDQVDDGVDGVADDLGNRVGRREVVHQTAHRHLPRRSRRLLVLPAAEPADEHVVRVALVEELREEVEVGDEGGLEDDGHVGGVEELDRVGALHAALRAVLDRQVDTEALEVDDDQKDEHRRHEVRQVGQVLAVESFLEALPLVGARGDEVEERDERALELRAAARVDRRWREGLPHDRLADVGRDEERDAGAETVALLQELVEDDDDDARDEELQDDEDRVARAQLAHVSVHARDDIRDGLTDGDEDAEELLRAREESTVLLETLVDIDDL
mmetsp:Transcript_34480/g.90737  ORF Transcript_34480/g.90737 Transcript_34480/m.90737 type:complete len:386 (+) Transcript_34480:534-1691(+)